MVGGCFFSYDKDFFGLVCKFVGNDGVVFVVVFGEYKESVFDSVGVDCLLYFFGGEYDGYVFEQ